MKVISIDLPAGDEWPATDEESVTVAIASDGVVIGLEVTESDHPFWDGNPPSALNWMTMEQAEEVYAALGSALAKVALRAVS
jgi:hypothetical protein